MYFKKKPPSGHRRGGFHFKMPTGTWFWVIMVALLLCATATFFTQPEGLAQFAQYAGIFVLLISLVLYLYFHNVQGTSVWVSQHHLHIVHGYRRRKIPIQEQTPSIVFIAERSKPGKQDSGEIRLLVRLNDEHEVLWFTHYLEDKHWKKEEPEMRDVVSQLNAWIADARSERFGEDARV